MGLRDLIDHITSGFGDQADVTQKDILDEDIRKTYPQYAQIPDAQLAAAAAQHMPDQYGYLSKFDPAAKIEPAKVPVAMRSDKFYQRYPDVASQEAKDALAGIRKEYPAYATISDQELAGAAEQKAPDQYKGLTAKLNAGAIEQVRKDAADKVFAVANDVSKSLQDALATTSGAPTVTKIRDAWNTIIAPKIEAVKADILKHPDIPSEDQIVKMTQESGNIPYGNIALRTAATTAVSMIPSKLEDFAAMAVIPEAGKVIGKAFPFLGKTLGELFPKTYIPEVMPDGTGPKVPGAPGESVDFAPKEQTMLAAGEPQAQIPGRTQAALPEGPAKVDLKGLPSGGTEGPGFRMSDHPDVAAFQEYLGYSPKTGESVTRSGYRNVPRGNIPGSPEIRTIPGVGGDITRLPPQVPVGKTGALNQDVAPNLANVAGDAGPDLRTSSTPTLDETHPLAGPANSSVQTSLPSDTVRTNAPSTNPGLSTTFNVGSIDSTSGRTITQKVSDVKQLLSLAKDSKPRFDEIIQKVADAVPGVKPGSTRVKEAGARLIEKVARQPSHTISDYLGGRLTVDKASDIPAVLDTLKKHGQIIHEDNFFAAPRHGYRAMHVQYLLPNGLSAELQITVPEIADAQELAHKAYDILRNPRVTLETRNKAAALSEHIFNEANQKHELRIQTPKAPEFGSNSPAAPQSDLFGGAPEDLTLHGGTAPEAAPLAKVGDQSRIPGTDASFNGAKPSYKPAGGPVQVPIKDLNTSPERFQPRKGLIQSRVQSLSQDMQDKGFNPGKPVTAWKDPKDGKLYVLAGHHRLAAAKLAGLDTVPAVIQGGSEADAIALARRSNSTRAPMTAIEEAKAYKAESDQGASLGEISKNYGGVKVTDIQRKLALNNLPPTLQDLVDQGQFPVGHAVELGTAAEKYGLSPTVQQQIFNEVVKKMDVTPATFRTMLDTLGPAAAKQVDMGLDFQVDQGILAPLRELAAKSKTLETARRQLSGYTKYVDNATAAGEKLSGAQLAASNQAKRAVKRLEAEIAQLRRSVGKAAKGPPPDLSKLFPQPASAETGAVKLGPDSPNMDLGNGRIATFKRELYDRFDPIKYKAGSEIAPEFPSAGGEYTESYVAARELKGKIRARGQDLLKELNDVVKPLANNADRQVLNKIYSLRNFAELDKLGKTTSGVTEQMANDLLAKLETEVGSERFNRISKVADQVADLQNNKALDILVEGKVITPETAQTLRDRYPHYLRSEILDQQLAKEHPEFAPGTNGEPLGRINKSFLKTKGGTKKLINTDVLDVVRRSLVTKVAAAEKQQVIDKVVQEFGTAIGKTAGQEGKIVTTVDPSKIPAGYVKSNVKTSDGQVYALRQDVEDLLQGLNRHQMDMVTNAMGSFNRIFKTGATTYRAPFVLSNLFRDTQELLFKGRSVPGQANRIASYGRAFLSSVKEAIGMSDADFEAWARGGGGYGGVVSSVPKGVRVPFRLLEPKQKMAEALKTAMMIPFKAVSIPAEVLENTSRLAEYLRLKPTALPESLKILQSRDITVDFEKMGDAMKVYNTWIPFLNPGVQGAVNIARAFKDQPIVSMGKLAAYIAVPTIGLYAWNRQFANDDTIDPYIKDNFWYVNTGATTQKDGRTLPIIMTMRKGETAQVFSYPIQNMLEYQSHDKNFNQHLQDFSPSGMVRGMASWLTPPAYKEPLEQAANYDFFRQGPIIPQRLENVRPGFQFTRGTTNTARKVGETLNASPIRLEHAAYGIWPASRQVLQLSDLVFNPHPTFPMKPKDALERSRDFQPIVRTPSGYFSQDEAAAKQFRQQYKEDQRTPAFLFKEALSRFADSRDPKDLQTAKVFAKQLPPEHAQRIVAQVQKEVGLTKLAPDTRAIAKMGKAERRAYARQLQTQNK